MTLVPAARTLPRVAAAAFSLAVIAQLGLASPAAAQSQTERGELAWKAGTTYALQGNADSALASFNAARAIAESVKDSSLLAAAMRGAAEVQTTYMGCADSALVLLRAARAASIDGDRTAGQLLIRRLAGAGKLEEARQLHTALYADIKDEVPRSITRESVNYLTGQAAIQRAANQHAAALATLRQARTIANRLATGDDTAKARAMPATEINSQNYWVQYEIADLMLKSKTRGVMSPADGKALMDAVANETDEPEEGNERRFAAFRLADRLALKEWRCAMSGEKCALPPPRKCR
ncbi:MAG: hypothetical protein ACO1Q7_14060 [Gemmatimonas sp.]